ASVEIGELAELGPPVVFDIGSGLLDATTPWLPGPPPPWLSGEPAARQSIERGAALVTFSGDKMFGGPQAGVIAGRADLVEACRRNPLARALRCGGLVLGALQDTALAYLRRDAGAIPFWRMATTPVEVLRERARSLGAGEVVSCQSVIGGGSLPGQEVPSAGVSVTGDITESLLGAETPVVARVRRGRTVLDMRTVDPSYDKYLAELLKAVT
ncbi:MAG: L-seryl-tRNA(Sec) selenium transferase, partial [Acidimicrobiales bacterium]